MLFNVDFEKSYDWAFLCKIMKLNCFSSKNIYLIMSIMVNGKFCVKMNNELGPYSATYKGETGGHYLLTF